MIRFRLDIAGEVQMDRGIARFAEGVVNYSPIWPVIAEGFYDLEKQQFATEGEEGGSKWPELDPDYAGWKEVHFPGQPILQRSGDLYRSLTSRTDPNAVYTEQPKTLTLGTRIPYAIYHQSIAPRTKLPRRPEIQLNEPFKRGAMRVIHMYLLDVATKSGFRPGGIVAGQRAVALGWEKLVYSHG